MTVYVLIVKKLWRISSLVLAGQDRPHRFGARNLSGSFDPLASPRPLGTRTPRFHPAFSSSGCQSFRTTVSLAATNQDREDKLHMPTHMSSNTNLHFQTNKQTNEQAGKTIHYRWNSMRSTWTLSKNGPSVRGNSCITLTLVVAVSKM